MSAAVSLRAWVKGRNTPLARLAYDLALGLRTLSMPVIPGLHRILYEGWQRGRGLVGDLARILWWTPLFRARLTAGSGRNLYLYGGLPLVLGPLRLSIGRDCRISGQTTLSGRTGSADPTLILGNNIDLGWQTTIAVGRRVIIGDHVRIAGRAFLAGYPGHPLDPVARAAGQPDTEDQIGDIVLEEGVWLATGVTVSAGVRIGRGTVVAAGSVVTRDLPANVLAAGVPARVIRPLTAEDSQ